MGWLLEKGFSVFVLSWINPDETYADYGLSDYVIDGVLDAVQKVLSISKQEFFLSDDWINEVKDLFF